jgi:hypothetical protein
VRQSCRASTPGLLTPTAAPEKKARSSPRIERVSSVTVNMALDPMSVEPEA